MSCAVRELRVRSGAIELAVYARGDAEKPTVILVHGYPDCSRVWMPVAEILAKQFHVVTYDVRGAGQSDIPQKTTDYRLELLSQDLIAVADAVCPGRSFHLVGHDWGSIQSWESVTANHLQSRILTFTSISGPSLDHVGMWLRRRLKRPSPKNLWQFFAQLCRSWYILMFQLPLLAELFWKFNGPRWTDFLWRTERIRSEPSPTQTADGQNGVKLYRANMLQRLLRPRPKHATMPVQIIVPLRDPYASPALFDELPYWVPKLSRRDIKAAHWLPLSQPQWLAGAIAQFIIDLK